VQPFWDLYIAFIDGPEQMMCRVQYNPDLFEAERFGDAAALPEIA